MKKTVAILICCILTLSVGCNKKEPQPEYNPSDYKSRVNVIEDSYVEILNTITANPTTYAGSTINIEGMFMTDDDGHSYVYRNGPECCYPDNAPCGFEFEKGDAEINEGDWILVSGELSHYADGSMIKLILKDCKVTKPETRGKETVEHTHTEPVQPIE